MVKRVVDLLRGHLTIRIATFIIIVLGLILTAFSSFFIVQSTTAIQQQLLEKGRGMARQGAAMVASSYELTLRSGLLKEADLFDRNYQKISGTDPQQYHTRFDAYTDSILVPMQNAFTKGSDILYAVTTDRNGYIPTHTTPERSKRIFDDAIGRQAASNTAPEPLVQHYQRDTGEKVWDISSPIFVNGQHWGAFRVGISQEAYHRHVLSVWLTMGLTGTGIVVLFSVMIVLLLRRDLKPLETMVRALEGVASGNLEQPITITSQDEIGRMGHSLQQMIATLRGVVTQVRTSAQSVESGVAEIGTSASQMVEAAQSQTRASADTSRSMAEMVTSIQHVARNAQTLASGVDEMSSAIEEMIQSIKQVASNADEASHEADQAARVAQEGHRAVQQTVEGMGTITQAIGEVVHVIDRLGTSSAEIGNIVAVINDIAEQTNLLALNAAIEAARAGEAGKGFAVVADEVRKLAERSAKSTGEIARLIRGIQEETNQAVTLTNQSNDKIQAQSDLAHRAGAALATIVEAINRVSIHMGGITQAMQEQAQASNLIEKGIQTMSQMTHQVSNATSAQQVEGDRIAQAAVDIQRTAQNSAAALEQVARSADSLHLQAQALRDAIAYFETAPEPTGQSALRHGPRRHEDAALALPGR